MKTVVFLWEFSKSTKIGEMAEWSIAFDLKSNEPNSSVSSNLTLSFFIFISNFHLS